ncbi:imelysin family protein [Aliiroseovarius sp.]|uniref:imelysin family protein n=1 Tax=Aliiroseovarius sp. TaxID=1872442 RepID=UPI003BAB2D7B
MRVLSHLARTTAALALIFGTAAQAQEAGMRVDTVLDSHVLPRFTALAEATETLKTTAADSCTPDGPAGPALEQAFHAAFDAWIGASHLRFGPTEAEDRAHAMAFWPDTKGFTKKALNRLIGAESDIVVAPERFADSSIAGRGLFALEYLLFDENMRTNGPAQYRCALATAIATDLDRNADAILADWRDSYADQMRTPGEDTPFRSDEEALQVLYQSLLTGLQFSADTRLGRPLGTFDRPRPRRAEAWRSQRSLANLTASLAALEELSALLAKGHDEVAGKLTDDFTRLGDMTDALEDPTFAGVADPMTRFRIEAIQTAINAIRETVTWQLGNALGVQEGFNALDGD